MSSHQLTEEEIHDYELQLGQLRLEHRDLDKIIEIMTDQGTFDQVQIRRLKKRKLALKDQIITLENVLIPDLDA
jgi:hypothetical protein